MKSTDSSFLVLRDATLADSALLFGWRNDPVTRENSHNQQLISRENHEIWFDSVLKDLKRQIYIAEINGLSVGMIRADMRSSEEEVLLSWSLSPTYRGRGLGTRLLEAAVQIYDRWKIIAEIRVSNYSSRAMAMKNHFQLLKTDQGIETWIREPLIQSESHMSKTDEIGKKLKNLIPGGCHTYSKGDDQWPQVAPKCLVRGSGCIVWDADNNEYIEWSMGLTSVCLGHANSRINSAAIDAMSQGHNFQRPAAIEAEAAERFLEFLGDRGEMVKFSKNGSTVTTAAVKLARAFTGRNKVAVCAEHPFFSYDDWFIGSTVCNSGVPDPIKELTVKFSYNDIPSVEKMFSENRGQVSCLILEPVKFERPKENFLQELAKICEREGVLLILDEMVTGFKWGKRGASGYYDVKGDLYTWGKGMANGHSVCALTGRRDVLELGGLEHDKPRVFLSSTTHGAEIPQLAAMIATLDYFEEYPHTFEENWERGAILKSELKKLFFKFQLEEYLDLVGEDLFFVLTVRSGGIHKINVARTFLLQELVKRGQLFQGLFYITPAHTDEVFSKTLEVWNLVLPIFKKFIQSGDRSELIGEPTRPVFRMYNSNEE